MDYITPNDLRAAFAEGKHVLARYDQMEQLINELANALEYAWNDPTGVYIEAEINASMYTPAFARQLITLARDVVEGEV